jgi:hypothetical protein
MYDRQTYTDLLRHEVVAPAVTNAGDLSGYPDKLGQALALAGFNWTAVETVGCWEGKVEPGRQFTIFAPRMMGEGIATANLIASIARKTMPDQDAIQVVVDAPINLIEA